MENLNEQQTQVQKPQQKKKRVGLSIRDMKNQLNIMAQAQEEIKTEPVQQEEKYHNEFIDTQEIKLCTQGTENQDSVANIQKAIKNNIENLKSYNSCSIQKNQDKPILTSYQKQQQTQNILTNIPVKQSNKENAELILINSKNLYQEKTNKFWVKKNQNKMYDPSQVLVTQPLQQNSTIATNNINNNMVNGKKKINRRRAFSYNTKPKNNGSNNELNVLNRSTNNFQKQNSFFIDQYKTKNDPVINQTENFLSNYLSLNKQKLTESSQNTLQNISVSQNRQRKLSQNTQKSPNLPQSKLQQENNNMRKLPPLKARQSQNTNSIFMKSNNTTTQNARANYNSNRILFTEQHDTEEQDDNNNNDIVFRQQTEVSLDDINLQNLKVDINNRRRAQTDEVYSKLKNFRSIQSQQGGFKDSVSVQGVPTGGQILDKQLQNCLRNGGGIDKIPSYKFGKDYRDFGKIENQKKIDNRIIYQSQKNGTFSQFEQKVSQQLMSKIAKNMPKIQKNMVGVLVSDNKLSETIMEYCGLSVEEFTNQVLIFLKEFSKNQCHHFVPIFKMNDQISQRVEMILASSLDYDKEFIARYKIKSEVFKPVNLMQKIGGEERLKKICKVFTSQIKKFVCLNRSLLLTENSTVENNCMTFLIYLLEGSIHQVTENYFKISDKKLEDLEFLAGKLSIWSGLRDLKSFDDSYKFEILSKMEKIRHLCTKQNSEIQVICKSQKIFDAILLKISGTYKFKISMKEGKQNKEQLVKNLINLIFQGGDLQEFCESLPRYFREIPELPAITMLETIFQETLQQKLQIKKLTQRQITHTFKLIKSKLNLIEDVSTFKNNGYQLQDMIQEYIQIKRYVLDVEEQQIKDIQVLQHLVDFYGSEAFSYYDLSGFGQLYQVKEEVGAVWLDFLDMFEFDLYFRESLAISLGLAKQEKKFEILIEKEENLSQISEQKEQQPLQQQQK